MNNFRTLLLAQIFTAFLLIIFLSLAFLHYSHKLIAAQQAQAKNAIEQIISTHITADGKSLSRQLERSYAFKHLQVSRLDGTLLYEQNNLIDESLMSSLMSKVNGVSEAITVKDTNQDIQIRFELNPNTLLAELTGFFYLLLLLPLIISILPILLIKAALNKQYRSIAAQVATNIHSFTVEAENFKPSVEPLPASLHAIEQALQQLNVHLAKKQDEITAHAQKITDEAYKDQVTGLPNRNRFVQTYQEHTDDETQTHFGIFAITRCTELQSINQSRGFFEGDNYVKQVSEIIKHEAGSYTKSALFRLNGSDFGILLPNMTVKEAENFANQLQSRFNEYQKIAELDSVAYTGLVGYEKGKALGELLATADVSISLAQTKQSNAWHLQKEDNGLENAASNYGNQNWRNVIEDVITNNRLSLLLQSIQPSSRTLGAYSEILVRFKTNEEQLLPTASFLAMAEKLDKIIEIDRLIIETSLHTIKMHNMLEQYFGINLSQRSVHDEQFLIWLERRLLKDASIAQRLVFEVSEYAMQQNLKTSKRFIEMVHRVGARVTVEKFGVGITSFKFFRDLKPDFVKMDGSYTRNIDEDKNNQYYMRLIIDLAHRIGVGVFAESVENQEEKHMLESLFIDGCQGYYIGKPVPI